MLRLITGANGAGKSVRAIERMYQYHADGVQVFACGFTNLRVPFAQQFPDPRRWRELPPNSVLFVDEAQQVWRARSAGQKIPREVEDLETHRHQGVDLVLITQSPSYIDSHLRSLISEHEHLVAWGNNAARIFKFAECFDDVKSLGTRSRGQYIEWKYPEAHFGDFDSAFVHLKKPKKPWQHYLSKVLFVGAGIVGVWSLWSVSKWWWDDEAPAPAVEAAAKNPSAGKAPKSGFSLFGAGSATPVRSFANAQEYLRFEKARIPEKPWSAPAYDAREVKAEPELYCMASGEGGDRSCNCKTEQGTRYLLPMAQCELMARWGPAYNPYKGPKQPASTAQQGGPGGGDASNAQFRIMHIMFKARWVTLARVWRYYWTLLRLLLDRLLHGDSSPDENRSLAACKSI
ncbi:zonular occludens toxin domain-containing protein [Pseudoxanthomonas sp. PXM04]|uniref:zonular occludens toxin domain-containing protein n=1 Tax=Pseudoxanthomonas sp. PXM04 TaxID=2769297 RepID=UPI00178210AE|nr:zonular occludens toxin domain-containing protein [Pseudoxanthomonas sp. PXM04]MBD9377932.1 hypothetical protein [Pseudoxanthomonas sp. PXM04]